MDTNLLNNYVLKAMDAYPYQLEETVENLNYALSYESNNSYALFLMGKLQAEQFGNYVEAKRYFEEALANKLDFQKVYGPYIEAMIKNEDYAEAQKLIDFAFTVKGLSKAEIWFQQGRLFESIQKLKKAFKAYKKSNLLSCDDYFIRFINVEIKRIKTKLKSSNYKTGRKRKKKKRK